MNECHKYQFVHNNKLKATEKFKNNLITNGISLYEVVRIVSGQAVFLADHLKRLHNSAKKLNIHLWLTNDKIKKSIQLLIEKNDCKIGNIKLVFNVTDQHENFYAYFVKHTYPSEKQYQNGVQTIIHPAERPIPTAKVYNHKLRSKTNTIIAEAAIYEVLLLNSMKNITEGSRSNLFFIKNNEIYTAPDNEVLNGIARSKVIDICNEHNIVIHKVSIAEKSLADFDAAFITGTSPMVLPIRKINSLKLDTKHPLLLDILMAYQQKILSDIK